MKGIEMANIGSSFKRSFVSLTAIAAGLALTAGTAFAVPVASSVSVPVYGSASDIAEDTVVLTGSATVSTQLVAGTAAGAAALAVNVHFDKVAGRSAVSGVALQASADQAALVPMGSSATVQFPVTVFPAGSDATDPAAFSATATLNVNVNPAGKPIGGASQFTIVLNPA
jgi:hypothetical protein